MAMKTYKYYILTGILSLMAVSCTDDMAESQQNEYLRVTAGMDNHSRTTFVDGEQYTKTHWVANDMIGLFTSDQMNLAYYAVSDGASSEFVAEGTAVTPADKKKVTAYYPYTNQISGTKVALPSNYMQNASDPAQVFLYSESAINGQALDLKFKHFFSYLKITVTAQQFRDNLPGGCTMDGAGIYISTDAPMSVYSVYFDLATQTPTFNHTEQRLFLVADDIDFEGDGKYTYMIPILPQVGNKKISFDLFYPVVDKEGYVGLMNLNTKETPAEGLEAGKVYVYDTTDYYVSTDYSRDGEVFTIQTATEGNGIDVVFIGEGFVDTDMAPGGKYEEKMHEAAAMLLGIEPYSSLRNRFNLYGVKVVSPTAEFATGAEKRINQDTGVAFELASKYNPNLPQDATMRVVVIYNTEGTAGRSYCTMWSSGDFVAFNMAAIGTTLIHEVGGHGLAKLSDEYVEPGYEAVTLPQDQKDFWDAAATWQWGWYANVDYNNTISTVRWSRFLNDTRYANDALGIYEGAGTYGLGAYRSSENSMMRYNIPWFNAPSREAIYKAVMTMSEPEGWTYDYETFVSFDANNIGQVWSSSRAAMEQTQEEIDEIRKNHRKPVFIHGSRHNAAPRPDEGNIIVPLK